MTKRTGKKPKKRRAKTTSHSPRRKPATKKRPERLEISHDELKAIIDQVREKGLLAEDDVSKLDAAVDTLAQLTSELELKGASIRKLRRLIFGASTEKTSTVTGRDKQPESPDDESASETADEETDESASDEEPQSSGDDGEKKKKRKGHGRNGADKYTGAQKDKVGHETLKHGDSCPGCLKGKVYRQKEPAVLVRVTGVAPLEARVVELERLRCNLCGEVFTAKAPDDVGEDKYDKKAAVMIALLKYGCGMPFNRLEQLEKGLGIPLPASTQWEVIAPAAGKIAPVFTELIRQAAQGEVLHNDDTTARILQLGGDRGEAFADDEVDPKRTGTFTSGVVSIVGGKKIALFFSGRKHAGENLADVLKKRAEELGPPIQMSDGLAVNTAGDIDSVQAECNVHARRKFVDAAGSYPEKVEHVLDQFELIYRADNEAKKEGMTPAERLAHHQAHSGPVLEALERWLKRQYPERKVEPNSDLGVAITYMLKHWDKLTLFLREEGVPLDNNICERALKKAILHRKNALFFKTQNGARVADRFMSLIHTTELQGGNPFDYLVAILQHPDHAAEHPDRWMPWNYLETLESLTRAPDTSPEII